MKFKATGEEKILGNEKSEGQINRLFRKITGGLMEIYVLFYLCLFPLCLRDKYFDIMSFRFELFWKPTFVYGCIFLLLGLLYIMCDALYNKGAMRHRFFQKLKKDSSKAGEKGGRAPNAHGGIRGLLHLSGTDIAMTVLVILFSLSTAFAEYPYEAFWGDRGRYQGLLIWLMFYVAYWLVTRFYKFKKWHIFAFMAFASIVCIWGICNFFMMTFGMFEHADDKFKYLFVSSIGNINTYTNFTGILFGVSAAVFIGADKVWEWIYSYIILAIAAFAQIMGISDNAILSTGIVFAVAPLILWKNKGNILRFFIAVLTYLGVMKITSLITLSGIETMNDADPSMQITMAGKGFFMALIGVVFVCVILSALAAQKGKSRNENDDLKPIKTLKRCWLILILAVVAAVVTVLILANKGINAELWDPYRNILIFNESWGTGRGLNWKLGMDFWRNDATLFMKLFGYGPDTYYIITMDRFMNIMQDAGYGMFDSAHNEYLEYFITVGILGLSAYISVLWCSLKTMLSQKNVYAKFMAIGVIAYAFQAVINIAIPITTPVFMMVMFSGLAIIRKNI